MKSFLDKYYNIIILSIYALVLLLRVYNLEQKNLWFDEIFFVAPLTENICWNN